MNEYAAQKITALLESLKRFALLCRDALWRFTRNDTHAILIIIVLAALLRFPALSIPDIAQFDEVTYADYALHIIHEQPLFDIHPPLARILFAEIARTQLPFSVISIPIKIGQPFDDFPYVFVRFVVACAGTLIPLLLYAILRLMRFHPRVALLPALFAVFDSALIIYSRTILPDTFLLLFEFSALLFAVCAMRGAAHLERAGFTLLSGLLIGCALSIKWTALGMFGALMFCFLLHRRYLSLIFVPIIAVLVYISIFVMFFHYFPEGGKTISPVSSVEHPWIRIVDFPKPDSLGVILRYLPEYHRAMLAAEHDPYVLSGTLHALGPYSWPSAQSALQFWSNQKESEKQVVAVEPDGRYIILSGNSVLWVMCFFGFIFNFAWVALHSLSKRKLMIEKNELLLMIGYAGNYLPFFFIHRPMYLYHYFTALLFLFLLTPYILPRVRHCISLVTGDRWFSYVFVSAAILLIFVNFALNAETTYGISFPW